MRSNEADELTEKRAARARRSGPRGIKAREDSDGRLF